MDQEPFVIRPVTANDLDWLHEISFITGTGFTSLPRDKKYMQQKLAIVEQSFQEKLPIEKRIYLFVRENLSDGERVGICGIHANVGYHDIFYNYQISTISQSSEKLNISLDHKVLNLVSNFQSATELVSFWVHPKYRNQHYSKSLSLSRFLFMAQYPQWFGKEVIAEIRGVCDEVGESPFWDAIGKHFFAMDFKQADSLTMIMGKQYIADLCSHEPIYLELLPQAAQQVVGLEHPTAQAARALLEHEGFRFNNHIDIFDGGPLLHIERDQITTCVNSKLANIAKCETNLDLGILAIIYNTKVAARITAGKFQLTATGEIIISEAVAKILEVSVGDQVRYSQLT